MHVANLLWQAITPVHVGTGQDGAGLVDLPVARESATGFPVLPASGVKGSYREGDGSDEGNRLYGTTDAQGGVSFTDARLLALAVPSYQGTFALVTSPLVIQRLNRDRSLLLGGARWPDPPSLPDARVVAGKTLQVGAGNGAKKVYLQDLALEAVTDDAVRQPFDQWVDKMLAQQPKDVVDVCRKRLCLVSDQVFSFLCDTALDVSPHVRLDPENKTVERGALWWEECIPGESLLSSFIMAARKDDLALYSQGVARRIGGKSTVGRGLVRVLKVA